MVQFTMEKNSDLHFQQRYNLNIDLGLLNDLKTDPLLDHYNCCVIESE